MALIFSGCVPFRRRNEPDDALRRSQREPACVDAAGECFVHVSTYGLSSNMMALITSNCGLILRRCCRTRTSLGWVKVHAVIVDCPLDMWPLITSGIAMQACGRSTCARRRSPGTTAASSRKMCVRGCARARLRAASGPVCGAQLRTGRTANQACVGVGKAAAQEGVGPHNRLTTWTNKMALSPGL